MTNAAAVVRCEDDDGVVVLPRLFQRRHHAAHALVHRGEHREVHPPPRVRHGGRHPRHVLPWHLEWRFYRSFVDMIDTFVDKCLEYRYLGHLHGRVQGLVREVHQPGRGGVLLRPDDGGGLPDVEVLYCTALYCTALYCTVLHCTALYLV